MAMNFVTFNQDYSYLAVGMTLHMDGLSYWKHLLTSADLCRHRERLSHIFDRPLREEL